MTPSNVSSAKLGQRISVALDVLGPGGPITDPSTLNSLLVGVTAAGNGLQGAVNVPVSSVAGQPGHYTGTFNAPNQSTTLTFTGTAAGYGLYTTQVPATVGVGTQTQGFTATPGFGGQTSVSAGGTIPGQVVFTNQTGSAKQVRLVLSVSGASASLTSPTGPVTVPAGNPPSIPFTVTVDKDSPTGVALFQVQAVDPATGQVYNTAEQDFAVTRPPGFIAQHIGEILGLIAFIIVARGIPLHHPRRGLRRPPAGPPATGHERGNLPGQAFRPGHDPADHPDRLAAVRHRGRRAGPSHG